MIAVRVSRKQLYLLLALLGVWAWVGWSQFGKKNAAAEETAAATPAHGASMEDLVSAAGRRSRSVTNVATKEQRELQEKVAALPIGRNPFTAARRSPHGAAPRTPVARGGGTMGSLRLTAVFLGGSRAVAVLNGREVREGDAVPGWGRLMAVTGEWVEVVGAGGKRWRIEMAKATTDHEKTLRGTKESRRSPARAP